MISFITSLAGGFGSGIVVPETGFALQNRGVGFSLTAGRANTVGPNKRPFHTIIPGFVTRANSAREHEPWLSFGIVGGPQQPQAHVQMLLNMLLFQMNLQQALDAPRFRHWRGNQVSFESLIAPSETAQIMFLGSNRGLIFGAGQAIVRNHRGYVAGSDSRRDGLAAAH